MRDYANGWPLITPLLSGRLQLVDLHAGWTLIMQAENDPSHVKRRVTFSKIQEAADGSVTNAKKG